MGLSGRALGLLVPLSGPEVPQTWGSMATSAPSSSGHALRVTSKHPPTSFPFPVTLTLSVINCETQARYLN